MGTFYVHRTFAAYVTEVTEIDATDAADALDAVMNSGGDYIGASIGDSVGFLGDDAIEVTDTPPISPPFAPITASSDSSTCAEVKRAQAADIARDGMGNRLDGTGEED